MSRSARIASALVGLEFYNQYFTLDDKANALGGIMSNAGASKIGR